MFLVACVSIFPNIKVDTLKWAGIYSTFRAVPSLRLLFSSEYSAVVASHPTNMCSVGLGIFFIPIKFLSGFKNNNKNYFN